jgi:D-alanine transaminase
MAMEMARRAGAAEAILVDPQGRVTEATHSSLLWVREGRVIATPEGPEILPGTTRRLVLRLLERLSVPFEPARTTLGQLRQADEVILAGTTIEVLPVVSIDGLAVSAGEPGPMARRLQDAFRRELDEWLASPI